MWRCAGNGTLAMLVTRVPLIAEAIDELDRELPVDSSIVRAHQHACRDHPERRDQRAVRIYRAARLVTAPRLR